MRFSYANDIGVLGTGRTARESAAISQSEFNSIFDWAQKNAISFNFDKTEVIQF